MSTPKRLTIAISGGRHLKLKKMTSLFGVTQEEMVGMLIELVDPEQIKPTVLAYKRKKLAEEADRKAKMERLSQLSQEELDALLSKVGS